jgi:hypothetical protein
VIGTLAVDLTIQATGSSARASQRFTGSSKMIALCSAAGGHGITWRAQVWVCVARLKVLSTKAKECLLVMVIWDMFLLNTMGARFSKQVNCIKIFE